MTYQNFSNSIYFCILFYNVHREGSQKMFFFFFIPPFLSKIAIQILPITIPIQVDLGLVEPLKIDSYKNVTNISRLKIMAEVYVNWTLFFFFLAHYPSGIQKS